LPGPGHARGFFKPAADLLHQLLDRDFKPFPGSFCPPVTPPHMLAVRGKSREF
jgi:hypothetical protein